MKIQLMSDLHLEWDRDFRPENNGADVLILSGDICVAAYLTKSSNSPYYSVGKEFKNFFHHCSTQFEHVIYIPGNHEYYNGYVEKVPFILAEMVSHHNNIHFLNNGFIQIDDVKFVGGTLWTDLNKGDPITAMTLNKSMNDFRLVLWQKNYRKFLSQDSAAFHTETKSFISSCCEGEDRVVVVTHHAPSSLSVHEKYKPDYYMNGGYHSCLEEFILDRPQIKLWTHGHMHDSFDYKIGDTRVVCNPKGYRDENKSFNSGLIIEV